VKCVKCGTEFMGHAIPLCDTCRNERVSWTCSGCNRAIEVDMGTFAGTLGEPLCQDCKGQFDKYRFKNIGDFKFFMQKQAERNTPKAKNRMRLILGAQFIGLAALLVIFNSGLPYQEILITISSTMAFKILSLVSASIGIAFFISLLWVLILKKYYPEGKTTDKSVIWVRKGTRTKVADGTVKAAYEYHHGDGSWRQKIRKEWKIIRDFGFLITSFCPYIICKIAGGQAFFLGYTSIISLVLTILPAGALFFYIQSIFNVNFDSVESSRGSKRMPIEIGQSSSLAIYFKLAAMVVALLCAIFFIGFRFLPQTYQGKPFFLDLYVILLFLGLADPCLLFIVKRMKGLNSR
jgi:hypothetical protein